MELTHIWDWFTDVFNAGGMGMGSFRVPFAELEAYSRMTNVKMYPWEALLIRRLSEVYMEVEDARHRKVRPPTLEVLMKELQEDEPLEPQVTLPKGMTKVMEMTELDKLKDFFRNLNPVKKRKAADGPRDDRPQS